MDKIFRDDQNKTKFNRKERRKMMKEYNEIMRKLYKMNKEREVK